MKKTLHLENWSLHFDGKRMDDQEYQVLVLKNERKEVKLEALDLPNGKADTVVKVITAVLDEYNLWKSIKMIVADTTNVNTGRRNGIVIQLQRLFVCSKESRRTTIYWLSTSYSGPSASSSHGLRTWRKQHIAQYRISIYPRTCKELRTAQDEFQER